MRGNAKGKVYGLVALIILLGLGIITYQRNTSERKNQTQEKKPPLVTVSPVKIGSITRSIETTGTVEAENAINIVPKLEQRIVWMPFKEGDEVRRGQLIVRLESAESAAQLSAALADVSVAEAKLRDVLAGSRPQEIKSAKAALAQTEANSTQASRDLGYIRQLYGNTGLPEQQLQEAQSIYDAAMAGVESARATLEDAEIELDRQKKMLKIGGVSQEDVDKAQTRYQVVKSAFASAKSALDSAKSNLDHVRELNVKVIPQQQIGDAEAKSEAARSALDAAKARLDLLQEGASPTQIAVAREQVRQASLKAETIRTQAGYCTIKSPVDGVITKLFMAEGDIAQPKQPIMSVSENGSMIVKAGVSDRNAANLKPGMPALVEAGQPGEKPLELKITRVYPAADPSTRLIPVEIALPQGSRIPQGAFAKITLPLESYSNVVVMPADAIVQKPGGKSVVFVVENGTAYARAIEAGVECKGEVQVLNGLRAGESLVVRGQEMLRDGVKVKVQEPGKQPGNKAGVGPGQGSKGLTGEDT